MKVKRSQLNEMLKGIIRRELRREMKECDSCGQHGVRQPFKAGPVGDEPEVHTMDTANLQESHSMTWADYFRSSEEAKKAYILWRNLVKSIRNPSVVDFVAGYNSAIKEKESQGLNEMTTSGAVFSGGPTIQVPAWGTKKKTGSQRALDATIKTGYKPAKDFHKNKATDKFV